MFRWTAGSNAASVRHMAQSVISRFKTLPTQARDLNQERGRISEWIERCNLILSSREKNIDAVCAHLLYMSTDFRSSAWRVRFLILQSINSTRRGRTNKEIFEDLTLYGFHNTSTLRGHLYFLQQHDAIERATNGRWILNRKSCQILEEILSESI
jgi:hypothetical protein